MQYNHFRWSLVCSPEIRVFELLAHKTCRCEARCLGFHGDGPSKPAPAFSKPGGRPKAKFYRRQGAFHGIAWRGELPSHSMLFKIKAATAPRSRMHHDFNNQKASFVCEKDHMSHGQKWSPHFMPVSDPLQEPGPWLMLKDSTKLARNTGHHQARRCIRQGSLRTSTVCKHVCVTYMSVPMSMFLLIAVRIAMSTVYVHHCYSCCCHSDTIAYPSY